MSAIEQEFAFEKVHLLLSDGTIFQPQEELSRRWQRVSRCGSTYGVNWNILYETKDGRYVLVRYDGCAGATIDDGADRRKLVWTGEHAYSRIVNVFEAERFVQESGGTVTPTLQRAYEEASKAYSERFERTIAERMTPTRHLEEWKELDCLPFSPVRAVGDVSYGDLAKEIYVAAVELVHALRRSPELSSCFDTFDGVGPSLSLCEKVFGSYNVNLEEWWGNEEIVPPAAVTVVELPWPSEFTSVQRAIHALRTAIEIPAHCFGAAQSERMAHRHIEPADADYRLAFDALRADLSRIERITALLGKSLRGLALLGRDESVKHAEANPIPRYIQRALNSYDLAEGQLALAGIEKVTDDVAYEWLETNAPLEYDLPDLESWKRYVRRGRRIQQSQKNAPRAGRSGRSVVSLGDNK